MQVPRLKDQKAAEFYSWVFPHDQPKVKNDLSFVRFMRFNNRFLRKILIRDDRAESSIVALYKKLELQNAMEILDKVSGDISAEKIVSLEYVCSYIVIINELLWIVIPHMTIILP